MSDSACVAIVYYSSTGTIYSLAEAVCEGAADAGAQVRLLRAAETDPIEEIAGHHTWLGHLAATAHVPAPTHDDVLWADAVIFGTPARFGNVAAQLKFFIDGLAELWHQDLLSNKVYSGFTSTASLHGGQESSLLALYNCVLHFGGLVVSPGFLGAADDFTRNPYGASHYTRADGSRPRRSRLEIGTQPGAARRSGGGDHPFRACGVHRMTMPSGPWTATSPAPVIGRPLAILAVLCALVAGAISTGPRARADATDDFPIPHHIIITTCDTEQYIAAARDTSPVYFERYMIDRSNRPADIQHLAFDRIHWFFSLDPAARRHYSEDTVTNVYYEQVATHWGNWAKLFFHNKGVVAKATDVCMNYPQGDMTIWDWPTP